MVAARMAKMRVWSWVMAGLSSARGVPKDGKSNGLIEFDKV
jgi:hypothetical protein